MLGELNGQMETADGARLPASLIPSADVPRKTIFLFPMGKGMTFSKVLIDWSLVSTSLG